jgi:quercetin dioxygenase-like cupin family protein
MRASIATAILSCAAVSVCAAAEPPATGAAPEAKALAIRAADPAVKWAPCPPLFPTGCRLTVLHGDPSKPNADVFLQVPAGYAIPAHSHTSAERMVLVSGELEVVYRGQPNTKLQPGQYAYGPPKVPHAAWCRSKDPCTLFIAFEQPVDALPYEGKLP